MRVQVSKAVDGRRRVIVMGRRGSAVRPRTMKGLAREDLGTLVAAAIEEVDGEERGAKPVQGPF